MLLGAALVIPAFKLGVKNTIQELMTDKILNSLDITGTDERNDIGNIVFTYETRELWDALVDEESYKNILNKVGMVL